MPELPEVETSRRGIMPHILGNTITDVVVRERRLRWPIPKELTTRLSGQTITAVTRRGKYILLHCKRGTVIIHLGMSGCLRILPLDHAIIKHDHLDFEINQQQVLRFNDPRRFGCILWCEHDIQQHRLIKDLGPEPLTSEFNSAYLYQIARGRKTAIKTFIMNSKIVVGVGNIYANEALHIAKIHPQRAAMKISKARCNDLAEAIKMILSQAIKQGGTTLRNFLTSDGKPGYFKQSLNVYGRGGENCRTCQSSLKEIQLNQRTTVYCGNCQR